MKCPKCGYLRQPSDTAPDWQCPACGVVYAKALQASQAAAPPAIPKPPIHPRGVAATQTDQQADQLADDAATMAERLHEQHQLAASGQKIVIYSIILNFVLRSAEQSHAFTAWGIAALFFAVSVYSVLGVLKICSGLDKSQNQKIGFMVLSFFPFINLVALIYLSAKTNRLLREAGWKVGLLGAKP